MTILYIPEEVENKSTLCQNRTCTRKLIPSSPMAHGLHFGRDLVQSAHVSSRFRIVHCHGRGGVQTAAQTASPDTQALQALVAEIRQLRQDMQATTIATQRVQIVLYRLQMQTTLVTRAASRLDDVRSSLGNTQSEKQGVSARMLQMEENLKRAQEEGTRKIYELQLAQMKPAAERIAADEQRFQSREIDAETQLRAEQAKLADLQDQLDRLDKLLDSFTRK